MANTRQWVDDSLMRLAGASDPTTVDFVLATASSAKSSSHLHSKLADFFDSSDDVRRFSDELYSRQKPSAAPSASAAAPKKSAKETAKPKRYTLVDMGDDDLPPPPKKPAESSRKRDRSRERTRRDDSKERDRHDKKHRSQKNPLRRNSAEMQDRWAEQETHVSDEDASPEPVAKRARMDDSEPEDLEEKAQREQDAAEDQDQVEKEEFEKRLRDREKQKTKGGASGPLKSDRDPKKSTKDLREQSRQHYLKKREAEQLMLLRKQVARQDEEERDNPSLSRRERADFQRDRETLRLAEERLAIDDHTDGYRLPDFLTEKEEADSSRKQSTLDSRYRDREAFTNEFEQWDQDQAAKAKAVQSLRTDVAFGNAADYSYVFDDSSQVNFVLDHVEDPKKGKPMTEEERRFHEAVDEAEKKTRTIADQRKGLPMYQYRDSLLDAIRDHQILVITAETGSGKTTQLPQYLYEAGYGKGGMKIGCTQPRRVAAMSVAARVSEEMGTRLGDKVGYSIRFEDKTSDETVIKYMTDGMLLREIMQETMLEGYSALMIDEAHERTIATDVLFAIVKDIARARPELRLLISSATLDAQKFSTYFDDAPIFSVPGRIHPVSTYYTKQPEANWLAAACTTIWQIHMAQGPGDILLFCTGEEDINACADSLADTARKLGKQTKELIICPVYANLPTEMQTKIFEKTPPGARKVVLATNIAETSLTIDGISFVIDPGFVKQNVYNARTGMESLIVVPISRASANQRSGRAGRTGPGRCFRLYTSFSYLNEMDASTPPEIQRSNLAQVVLLLKSIGINDMIGFDFIDPPSPDTLIRALEELYMLGALNSRGSLTKIGRAMAELPIAPMMSKAILAADKLGCVDEVITIISMLGESASLFFRPRDKRVYADSAHARFKNKDGGDHLTLLNVWNSWCDSDFSPMWAKDNYVQQRSLTRARDVREQLLKLCERVEVTHSSIGPSEVPTILKAITSGYFANAARLQKGGDAGYKTVKTGVAVHIHPSSVLAPKAPKRDPQTGRYEQGDEGSEAAPPSWVIFDQLVLTSREFMRGCFELNPAWLAEVAPHYYDQKSIDKMGGDASKRKMPLIRKSNQKL